MPDKAVQRKFTLVAATDTQLLPTNPLRMYAMITNDGTDDVYLGFGTPAVMSAGHRLNHSGGFYEIIKLLNDWTGEIRAISAGTPKLLIVEW